MRDCGAASHVHRTFQLCGEPDISTRSRFEGVVGRFWRKGGGIGRGGLNFWPNRVRRAARSAVNEGDPEGIRTGEGGLGRIWASCDSGGRFRARRRRGDRRLRRFVYGLGGESRGVLCAPGTRDGEVGRASGGGERREVCGLTDAPQEPVDGLLILHQCDEAHAAPAARACGKIIAEGATEKLGEAGRRSSAPRRPPRRWRAFRCSNPTSS